MTIFPVQIAAMTCASCGNVCDRKSKKRVYCEACAKARRFASSRARKRKLAAELKRQPKPVLYISCASCGCAIQKRTSQHKFCHPCRLESDKISRRQINLRARSNDAARDSAAKYQRERRLKNPKYAMGARMSAAIYQSLRDAKAGRSWEKIVGFTKDELAAHLERQFSRGMSWKNYGEWHIDHIRPISSFNYSSENDAEFRACWSLANLRPLWALENLSKNARRDVLI